MNKYLEKIASQVDSGAQWDGRMRDTTLSLFDCGYTYQGSPNRSETELNKYLERMKTDRA